MEARVYKQGTTKRLEPQNALKHKRRETQAALTGQFTPASGASAWWNFPNCKLLEQIGWLGARAHTPSHTPLRVTGVWLCCAGLLNCCFSMYTRLPYTT